MNIIQCTNTVHLAVHYNLFRFPISIRQFNVVYKIIFNIAGKIKYNELSNKIGSWSENKTGKNRKKLCCYYFGIAIPKTTFHFIFVFFVCFRLFLWLFVYLLWLHDLDTHWNFIEFLMNSNEIGRLNLKITLKYHAAKLRTFSMVFGHRLAIFGLITCLRTEKIKWRRSLCYVCCLHREFPGIKVLQQEVFTSKIHAFERWQLVFWWLDISVKITSKQWPKKVI